MQVENPLKTSPSLTDKTADSFCGLGERDIRGILSKWATVRLVKPVHVHASPARSPMEYQLSWLLGLR